MNKIIYRVRLTLNRQQLMELYSVVEFGILRRQGDSVEIEFKDLVENIRAALIQFAPLLEVKIFNAKIALEELVSELQNYHGCKGQGTSKSVFVPLHLDEDVSDHIQIYKGAFGQGLQVSSYETEWIDPEQE